MPAAMTRVVLVGVAVLSIGFACSEKSGKSLVLVDLTVDPNLDPASVGVIITRAGTRIGGAVRHKMPWKLGAYLDKSVTGSVDAIGCAFDDQGTVLAASMAQSIMVHPGDSTDPVSIALVSGRTSSFCGDADGGQGGSTGGTAGGAGMGGTSGNGGGGIGGSAGAAGSSGGGAGAAGGSG